jgi:hypothetical protein
VCQRFVRNQLRAPSTAEFPAASREYAIEHAGGGTYTVRGYVDAQNAFGGTVRQRFVCMTTHKDGDTWGLDNVALLDW